jgi:hypothetical protein
MVHKTWGMGASVSIGEAYDTYSYPVIGTQYIPVILGAPAQSAQIGGGTRHCAFPDKIPT